MVVSYGPTIPVDRKTYEAKLEDSDALRRVLSYLMNELGASHLWIPGDAPDEFIIRYVKHLKEGNHGR